MTPISLDSSNWNAYRLPGDSVVGALESTDQGLKLHPLDRDGRYASSIILSDFANSVTKIKWSAYGGGSYEAVYFLMNSTPQESSQIGLYHPDFTTLNPWDQSQQIQESTWYYSTITIGNNRDYSVTTTTGNYVDAGGINFNTSGGTISSTDWARIHSSGIGVAVIDSHYAANGDGTVPWVMLGEVSTSATPVPEPSNYLAGCSALGMLLFAWRNRK
jgi:hypothetical protein